MDAENVLLKLNFLENRVGRFNTDIIYLSHQAILNIL